MSPHSILRRLGKTNKKVIAVFAISPAHADHAVRYIRDGAPGIPVWLFATRAPAPETAALCERAIARSSSLALFFEAERALWRRWVALGVTTWTGEPGRWPVKLAPFFIPPFRALIINRPHDVFPGTPRAILRHLWRLVRDAAHSGAHRARDISAALWLLLVDIMMRLFHGLVRWILVRIQGDQIALPPIESTGESAITFRQQGKYWMWRELAQFARTSTARWILWTETGAKSPSTV